MGAENLEILVIVREKRKQSHKSLSSDFILKYKWVLWNNTVVLDTSVLFSFFQDTPQSWNVGPGIS
jgi:hypothetical protein